MANYVALLLVIVAVSVSLVTAKPTNEDPPDFGKQYSVMGVLKLPYAELQEPFTAYIDQVKGRSRLDYYGGVVSIIMRSDHGPYGEKYTLAPLTTYKVYNKRSCFKLSGTNVTKVSAQVAVPDLTAYKNAGEMRYLTYTVVIWEKVEEVGSKKNTYTMWVAKGSGAPIRFQMMGYDTLFGSHYDKYVIDYIQFWKGNPDESHFEVPENMTCTGFPGPGEQHMASMNPLLELVDRKTQYIEESFEHFKVAHSKKYKTKEEHRQRKYIFMQNLRYIQSKNRAGLTYRLAVNHLADYTEAELEVMRGLKNSGKENNGLPFDETLIKAKDIPDTKDWRIDGAVTQVKDQAVCGSCWSFGTTGTIEGAYFLKTKKLIRLSQQELVDCSWGEGNNGCDGGEDFRAYDWIERNGGLASEDDYGPYLAIDGYCKSNKMEPIVKLKGYVNITSGSEDALKASIAKFGPISVGIDASHKSLSFYANGVYYEPKCGSDPDSLDHAVLAVGYGVYNGEPYWLVKNSWSTYWGNNGYVLMSRKDNNCGVTTAATYVIVE